MNRKFLPHLLSGLFLAALFPALSAAKTVTVEWEPVDGAVKYEFRIESVGKPVIQKNLESAKWRGELDYGAYTYRLRAVDKMKNPGEWTEPAPLVVMAPPPTPLLPEDGAVFGVYRDKVGTTLSWQPVPGVRKYRVKISDRGKTLFEGSTEKSQMETPSFGPGDYSWEVSSIIEGEKKHWDSKPGKPRDFALKLYTLSKPVPLEPTGPLPPPKNRRLDFTWEAVDRAQAYEVTLVLPPKPQTGRTPASPEPQETRKYVIKSTSAALEVPRDGKYSWKIRALAQINEKQIPSAFGPESVSEFQVTPRSASLPRKFSGSLGLSLHSAPYSYNINSPSADARASVNTANSAFRIIGEMWFTPTWGASLAMQRETLTLNRQNFGQTGFQAAGLYRVPLESSSRPWTFTASFGPELRQFVAVVPLYSSTDQFLGVRSDLANSLGAGINLSFRKQFSWKWGMEFGLQHFQPLTLMGSNGKTLLGDKSKNNNILRAQAVYTINPTWSACAGVAAETQAIGYSVPTGLFAGAGTTEEISGTSRYIHATVTYRFPD